MAWNIPGVPTTQNTQGRVGIQVFHYSALWVWPDPRRMKKSLSWQSSFGQEAKELRKQFVTEGSRQESPSKNMSGYKNSPLSSSITANKDQSLATGVWSRVPGCVQSAVTHLWHIQPSYFSHQSLNADPTSAREKINLLAEATREFTAQTLKGSIWQRAELNTLRVGLLGCPEQDQELNSTIPVDPTQDIP